MYLWYPELNVQSFWEVAGGNYSITAVEMVQYIDKKNLLLLGNSDKLSQLYWIQGRELYLFFQFK
jgi:hypothetical protein